MANDGDEVEDSWLIRFASTCGGGPFLACCGLSLVVLAMGLASWLAHR